MKKRMSRKDLETLFDNKLYEICDRENMAWYEVVSFLGFDEMDEWVKTLHLNKNGMKVYDEWCTDTYYSS